MSQAVDALGTMAIYGGASVFYGRMVLDAAWKALLTLFVVTDTLDTEEVQSFLFWLYTRG